MLYLIQEVTTGGSQSVAEQAAQLDMVMLVLTAVGLGLTAVGVILSGLAAWAAFKSVSLTRVGVDKQEEQLNIERDLVSMIPRLKVTEVGFSHTSRFAEVADTLQERDQAIRNEREERQREEERRLREEQRRERERRLREDPNSGSMSDWLTLRSMEMDNELEVRELDVRQHFLDPGDFDPYTLEQRDYRGPEPHAVMQVVVKNVGRIAANDITGTVTTSAKHVMMLNFPGLDAEAVTQPDDRGNHTAEVSTIRELLPGRSDVFRIGVVLGPEVRSSEEQWSLAYDFITPSGHGISGRWPSRPETSDNS
jgi:hypothetical protein